MAYTYSVSRVKDDSASGVMACLLWLPESRKEKNAGYHFGLDRQTGTVVPSRYPKYKMSFHIWNTMSKDDSHSLANSLMRGLLVLECFSPEKDRLSLAQLATILDMPKSSLFRVVKTLSGLNYLRYDDQSRTYRLGTRVLSLGFSVLQGMELRELARPYLEGLSRRFSKTVNLAVLDKHEMVYVERVKVPGYRDFNIGIGSRIPAWNTSVGKAVLAYVDHDKLNEIVKELKRLPDFLAGGGETRLADQLEIVRRDGFAINDRDVYKKWVRAIAVPVFSPEGVACAINIVVEPEEVSVKELRAKYAPALLAAGKELSEALGHRS